MANSSKDARVIEYKDTINELNKTIQGLNELISTQQKTIVKLEEQVEHLTNKLFGKSSEKIQTQSEGQVALFDEVEQEATATDGSDDTEEITVISHMRKVRRTKQDMLKDLPSRDVVIPLTEEQLVCGDCGAEMVVIGKEYVRNEVIYIPPTYMVINYYRETAKCPVCSEKPEMEGSVKFVKSEVPEPLIPHSDAHPSTVAAIIHQKYALGIPLYRQEQELRQHGVFTSRATLANRVIYCTGQYFRPLWDFFHRCLVKREFLMADETRAQVLKEPGRNPETDSYMWVFRSGEDGLPPIIIFHYTQTRAKFNAEAFLKGFSGYLETDGYQGYNNLPHVKRCCCWAHMRRYFLEAIPKGKQMDQSEPAVQAVTYINKLFACEAYSKKKNHTFEQRHDYRLKKEVPILDAFWKWVDLQSPDKGTNFDKAVKYARKHKDLLMTYLEDGRCSFSNNLTENSIRPFTVGRKNWLFSDSMKGAEASAICYTIIEMAKAYGLNDYKYIKFLLERLPRTPMNDEALAELAPWNEAVKKQCSGPVEYDEDLIKMLASDT